MDNNNELLNRLEELQKRMYEEDMLTRDQKVALENLLVEVRKLVDIKSPDPLTSAFAVLMLTSLVDAMFVHLENENYEKFDEGLDIFRETPIMLGMEYGDGENDTLS